MNKSDLHRPLSKKHSLSSFAILLLVSLMVGCGGGGGGGGGGSDNSSSNNDSNIGGGNTDGGNTNGGNTDGGNTDGMAILAVQPEQYLLTKPLPLTPLLKMKMAIARTGLSCTTLNPQPLI